MKNHRVIKRSNRAFTLMEVLFALAILLIGLVAVAAIYPPALLLQRQTVEEVMTQHAYRNSEAVFRAFGLREAEMSAYPADSQVRALLPYFPSRPINVHDRSYPATDTDLQERRLFWVPMIQDARGDAANRDWRVFLCIVRRPPGAAYTLPLPTGGTYANDPTDPAEVPRMARIDLANPYSNDNRLIVNSTLLSAAYGRTIDEIFRIGDLLVDSNGSTYRVLEVDASNDEVEVDGFPTRPTHVWVGWRFDGSSAAVLRQVAAINGGISP